MITQNTQSLVRHGHLLSMGPAVSTPPGCRCIHIRTQSRPSAMGKRVEMPQPLCRLTPSASLNPQPSLPPPAWADGDWSGSALQHLLHACSQGLPLERTFPFIVSVILDQKYANCGFPNMPGHPREILSSLSLEVIKLIEEIL